jgi:RimJ/RimL family protein N-acetyltransferase
MHEFGKPITVEPVTLEGAHVRLEPLELRHVDGWLAAGVHENDVFKWYPIDFRAREDFVRLVDNAHKNQAAGSEMPFATVHKASGQVVGGTRYMNIDRANHRLEIGFTFISKPWQRSAVNTEAKYLQLCHAFETLGCMRVELKTDSLNEASRNAMLRIGCEYEGVFRNHMIMSSGRIRHSAWYSITDDRWPEVKQRLEGMLRR